MDIRYSSWGSEEAIGRCGTCICNLEDNHLAHLVNKHKITAYFRYVDDVLLIYDSHHTNIQNIQNDFNMIHPNIKFTTETETNNKINYLDITIHRTPTNWVTSIHRKPTFTDTIIPYSSNHPTQHKYAAIRYLYHRLDTYHLKKTNTKKKKTPSTTSLPTMVSLPTHTNRPLENTPLPHHLKKQATPHTNGYRSRTLAKKQHSSPTYSKKQTWESPYARITPFNGY